MKNWIYLSHLLNENTPAYGGGSAFKSIPDKSMENGDSCNTSRWTLSNHIGTHIDFPRHFSVKGKVADDYPANFWIFDNIAFIDLSPVEPGQIICWKDLTKQDIPSDTELLIIKTGFSEIRNKELFWQKNPGLHPDIANQLTKNSPKVRAFGVDSISISSYTDRDTGRSAHKAFLDAHSPILLLEDMDLSGINNKTIFHQVIITPIRVQGADASPCTVLAEIEKE